jgi:hypothetical protein
MECVDHVEDVRIAYNEVSGNLKLRDTSEIYA